MSTSLNVHDVVHHHIRDSIPYTTRYATVFVYHALFAALAWALLGPFSHLVAHLQPTTSFSVHRAAMVTVAGLTVLSYVLGYLNSTATPSQHKILTNGVLLAVALQSLAGVLRPDAGENPWRRAWAKVHSAFGVFLLGFSFFVVAHSLSVFQVDGWLYVAIVGMLVLGASATLVRVFSGFTGMVRKHESNAEVLDNRQLLSAELDSDGDV